MRNKRRFCVRECWKKTWEKKYLRWNISKLPPMNKEQYVLLVVPIKHIHRWVDNTTSHSCCENIYCGEDLQLHIPEANAHIQCKRTWANTSVQWQYQATVTEVDRILSNTQNKPDTSNCFSLLWLVNTHVDVHVLGRTPNTSLHDMVTGTGSNSLVQVPTAPDDWIL